MATCRIPCGFKPFLEAMADAPGELTNLLVFADWLDEHGWFALAKTTRAQSAALLKRYRRAVACQDALLAVDVASAWPVAMPVPDGGNHRSRQQWRNIVCKALAPFKLAGVSVAATPSGRGGADVELRLPPADLFVGVDNDGFAVPWGVTSSGLLTAGVLAFSSLMARLFPEEEPRAIHNDDDSFDVSFWRVAIRSQT